MALDTPTDAELAILQVLWEGPATVRAVHTALGTDSGYTTTLKLMQIMFDKGLVRRDESARSHVYEAAVGREAIESGLVTRFMERVFAGSAARLVQRALQDGTPAEELAEIRRLLDEAEEA